VCGSAGLACLAVATTCTVLLLTDEVVGDWGAIVITVCAAILFVTLWFVLPLRHRWRAMTGTARVPRRTMVDLA
jgi:hypothetical protein